MAAELLSEENVTARRPINKAVLEMSKHSDKVKDLEIDLACIAWARRQKEREVRQALQTSIQLKRNDLLERVLLANRQEEHKAKKSQIIHDELSRMLVFKDEDLFRLNSEETNEKRKYQRHLERHLENIAMLGTHIQNRPGPKTPEEMLLRSAGVSQLKQVEKEVHFEISTSEEAFFEKIDSDKWRPPLKLT